MKKVLAGMLAFVMVFALMPKFANVEAITETQANLVLDGHVLELSYNVQNSGQEQAAYSELLTKLTQWSQGNWWASNPNLSFRFIEFPNVPGRAAVDISSTAQATFTNFEHNTRYLMKVYALYSNSSGQYMELVKDWVYLTLRNDNSTPTNKIINVPELVLDCSTLQKETQSYADLYAWLKLKSDAQNNYWVNAQMLYYIMKEFPADIPNADSLSVANVDWYSAPLIGDLHVGKGLDFDKRYLLCPAASWYTGTEPSQPSSKIEGLEFFYLTLQQSVPTTMPTPTPLIAPTPTPFIAPTPTPLVLIEDFKDIPKIHWGYEDAKWAIESGLMNGVYSDTFEPDGTLTRGMLVTIL
ncbi:MAG: S-layer homology domain-containing protein, partial [Oscillospiraceae bacterium]|nr:S-layer homology domain-containing protein [Oscillospiraceae bacterium]